MKLIPFYLLVCLFPIQVSFLTCFAVLLNSNNSVTERPGPVVWDVVGYESGRSCFWLSLYEGAGEWRVAD